MRTQETRKLDRLLSGSSGLSVQEKERVLDGVLKRVALQKDRNQERRALPWLATLGAGLATAAAVGVIVTRVGWQEPTGRVNEHEFEARGDQGHSGSFGLRCLPEGTKPTQQRAGSVCHQGDRLFFKLQPAADSKYFSAAALASDGLLIWYFPSDTRPSIPVQAAGLADMSVLITNVQSPGRYRVFGAFSAKPLTQAELRTAIERYAVDQSGNGELSVAELEVMVP